MLQDRRCFFPSFEPIHFFLLTTFALQKVSHLLKSRVEFIRNYNRCDFNFENGSHTITEKKAIILDKR